ncbi:MAG: radical SAM protein [Desulfamplus sp.]|nr:radical SAM protein [Desulfamplus sp.]
MVDKIIYPEEIILEVTNLCNLKCKFCHFHGEDAQNRRKLGLMPPEIWKKLLNEIDNWNKPCTILTHGAGEPLLYPHLEDLLSQAKKNPKLGVGFMTNGMLLTSDISKMLVSLKIDSLALSIDGIIPETHDHFRKNADLKLIEKNLEYLISEKERSDSNYPALTFNMVGYPDILDQEEGYVKKWLPHADVVMISKFRPVGSRKLWDSNDDLPFTPCPLLYNQTVISIDGFMGLCCEDINLDVKVGNVLQDELLTLYNSSPTLNRYRDIHEKNRDSIISSNHKSQLEQLKLCSDCDVWSAHIRLESQQKQIGNMKVSCEIYPSGKVYRKI